MMKEKREKGAERTLYNGLRRSSATASAVRVFPTPCKTSVNHPSSSFFFSTLFSISPHIPGGP